MATVWLLACIPVAIMAMQLVLEIGWLHRTRSEVQVAADSAALAGARAWGTGSADAGSDSAAIRTSAKVAAHQMLAAHTVSGTTMLSSISDNNSASQINNNQACPGTILLGDFEAGTFAAGTIPATADRRACRCNITVTVPSPFGLGTRTVSATATAAWSSGVVQASLVTVTLVSCL